MEATAETVFTQDINLATKPTIIIFYIGKKQKYKSYGILFILNM